ncbi:MAG: thiol:disulfide interchange protein DsbA/DsbL [Burkholderiales bacterium]
MNLALRHFHQLFALLVFCAVALPASAQAPVGDKEYKLISPAQPVQGKGVEVIEFFSYACSHCAEFESPLRGWLKTQPQDVSFKAVPLIFRESWAPLARLYYTLEAMGLAEKLHSKVFHAIHAESKDLGDADKIAKWVATQGVDAEKFTQTFNSFGIDAKVERSKKMGRSYGVMFTPTMAIQGKYVTGPSMAVGPNNQPSLQRFFQVVDALIARERGKNSQAPVAPGDAPKQRSAAKASKPAPKLGA